MVKVSVVVPVYNEESYLRECLDSITGQTLKEIEIICVDDGSTDNSMEILKEYARQDKRVIILEQHNSGAGMARNRGMKQASGEYLAFLDSDDIYEKTMLEEMYQEATDENLDMVVCRVDAFNTITGQEREIDWSIKTNLLPARKPFAAKDVHLDIFSAFIWWPWDKIFKRSYIEETGLQFQNLRTTNDLYFVAAATVNAARISWIEKILAHHRTGLKSSLSVTRENSWDCFYHALVKLKSFMEEKKLYHRFRTDFINYALNFSLWQLNSLYGHSYSLLYNMLKEQWFYELEIAGQTEDFFYNKKSYQQMKTIMATDLESYLLQRILLLEQQNRKNAEEITKLKNTNKNLELLINSVSFKIGRSLTFFPRKLRDFIR